MQLFKVFLSFFLIVGAIFAVSLFFPRTYLIERSVTVNRPVGCVYGYMSDFRNWERWSLWNTQTDSTLGYFYGKRSDSTGGRQYFYGALLGPGRFVFDEAQPGEKLVYNLYMHGGEVNAKGTFLFTAEGETTRLHWVDSGDVGYNPLFRFMLPSKTRSTEKTFDDGLGRIKEDIEHNGPGC